MTGGVMVKKVSKTKKHKVYKLLIALCSLVILIVAIAIVLHIKNENKISNAQNGMSGYLKNKYNEDFKVERPEYKHGGFGVSGSWKSHAYPISNPQLRFYIGCVEECNDEYLDLYFSRQEYDRLQSSMKAIGVTDYSIRLIIKDEVLSEITKSSSLGDIKRRYDPIYKLSIKIVEADNRDDITNKVASIIEEIYSQGVSKITIDYTLVTRDRRVYTCVAGYDVVPQLNYGIIKQCLKES